MTKTFPARRKGTCAYNGCPHSGKVIEVGQLIRWNRAQRGIAWHDACYAKRNDMVSTNTGPKEEIVYMPPKKYSTTDAMKDIAAYAPPSYMDIDAINEAFGVAKVKEAPKAIEPPKSVVPPSSGLFAMLANEIEPFLNDKLKAKVDMGAVEVAIAKALNNTNILKVTEVVVDNRITKVKESAGLVHKNYPVLLQMSQVRTADGFLPNIWLQGPAASGKTTASSAIAKALTVTFYSHGAMESAFQLLGFIDAGGKLVRTPFRNAFENGGVCLLDEVDAFGQNASLALNGALANGECSFPDGMVKRHKDFICIAAANTWGLGGTNDYVGRLKLDAAFLDRFITLDWPVDEGLELATAGNPAWVKRVQSIRAKAKTKGLKVIISPRASYYGAALLSAGVDQVTVEASVLRKAMTPEQWESVK